jgi:predicted transposase YbfD/YdcC
MSKPIRPLAEVVAEIPDVRQARGKRHPLPAVLLLSFAAMLCGYRSYAAIAEWGRNYGPDLLRALGFTRATPPCAATLYLIFKRLDVDALEAALGGWAEGVLAALPDPAGGPEAVALDGKTLRGSRKQGAPGAHLLSALSHRLGLTLGQAAIPTKKGEQTALYTLLDSLLIQGRVLTMDSLHTSRRVARTIAKRGGFYVMIVKKNQPQLREDIVTLFAEPEMVQDTFTCAETTQSGHGRVERRRLTASSALVGFSTWPAMEQAFQVERKVITKKTGECRHETVEGVTNLCADQATAAALLAYVQHHWGIETKSHWVRDVTFDEDRSQVRTGVLPEVLAAVRCATLGLLRVSGATNIAAACRYYAAQPWAALALLGIVPQN